MTMEDWMRNDPVLMGSEVEQRQRRCRWWEEEGGGPAMSHQEESPLFSPMSSLSKGSWKLDQNDGEGNPFYSQRKAPAVGGK